MPGAVGSINTEPRTLNLLRERGMFAFAGSAIAKYHSWVALRTNLIFLVFLEAGNPRLSHLKVWVSSKASHFGRQLAAILVGIAMVHAVGWAA